MILKEIENTKMFEECVEYNNKLWVFTYKYNALCTMSYENGQITYVSSIPNEEFCKERLVSKIVPYYDDLILLPMSGKNINIYHVKTNIWNEVKIPDTVCEYEPNYKFMEAVISGRYLYAIGCSYPGIIQIDLMTYKIIKVVECYVDFTPKAMQHIWVRTNCVKKENKLYLASCVSNEVMIFYLDELSYKIIKIGNEKNQYSGIALDNEGFFWLSPFFHTNIVKWDGNEKYEEIQINAQSDVGFFSGVIICDKIKIFPRMLEGHSLVIDENDNISEIDMVYHLYKKISSDKYIYEDFSGKCCLIENGKAEKNICKVHFEDVIISRLEKKQYLLNNAIYQEDSLLFNLKNYIGSVKN